MSDLQTLLKKSATRHNHLCPRQVLGVRMALVGAAALGMEVPRNDKKMLIIVETDGCFADGIEIVTGCTIGHRTLQVKDYGKIAATFIQVKTGLAVRLAPHLDVRERARLYAPGINRRYFTQLEGYKIMPVKELFSIQEVTLNTLVETIISRAGVRVYCSVCGEEIINQREVLRDDMPLCKSCAGFSYYHLTQPVMQASRWKSLRPQEVST